MRRADVAVIGAGPAGVGAALAAAGSGAFVTVIDENPLPGGHLRWSIGVQPGRVGALTNARGFDIARWADDALRASAIDLVLGAAAWGLFSDNVIGVVSANGSYQLRAERIIVATGSTDMVASFPGWELPGVMTASAALKLLHLQRVLPGRRVVVIGDGAYAGEVADAITIAGASVVGRARSADRVAAGGSSEVAWVEISDDRIDADCVVIALGRQPDPELAIHGACAIEYSERDASFVPARSSTLETSATNVYAVGDCAGICSAAEAYAEGTVAGIVATGGDWLDQAISDLESLRASFRRGPREPLAGSTSRANVADSLVVCRCEEAWAGAIHQAISEGAASINDIKRRTRAGMGACQGFCCERTMRAMLWQMAGLAPASVAPMTIRPPARIVPLAALAGIEE